MLLARQYDLICCALGEDERRLARKASGLAQAQDAGPGNSDGQQQAQHEVKPVPHQTALGEGLLKDCFFPVLWVVSLGGARVCGKRGGVH